jgi:hypothetical protein
MKSKLFLLPWITRHGTGQMNLIGFSLKSILYQEYADDVREADRFDEEVNIDLLITPPRKGTDDGVAGGIYFAS